MSRTQSLFVNDLKQYRESHKVLKDVYEIFLQESHDTRACFRGRKGGWGWGEGGLPVLEQGMETMDPDENEIFKFLGVKQVDGIKTKAVFARVKSEVEKGSKS